MYDWACMYRFGKFFQDKLISIYELYNEVLRQVNFINTSDNNIHFCKIYLVNNLLKTQSKYSNCSKW